MAHLPGLEDAAARIEKRVALALKEKPEAQLLRRQVIVALAELPRLLEGREPHQRLWVGDVHRHQLRKRCSLCQVSAAGSGACCGRSGGSIGRPCSS